MRREIPAERWNAFVTVAAASRRETVVVACRSHAVRHQYEQAIRRLGGNINNVVFRTSQLRPRKEVSTVPHFASATQSPWANRIVGHGDEAPRKSHPQSRQLAPALADSTGSPV